MAKIELTKNASRNIFFGVILKIYQILVPFLMRAGMIYLMGGTVSRIEFPVFFNSSSAESSWTVKTMTLTLIMMMNF